MAVGLNVETYATLLVILNRTSLTLGTQDWTKMTGQNINCKEAEDSA